MTTKEKEIMEMLGEVYNEFINLPTINSNEQLEFTNKIHELQRMVMIRDVYRNNYSKEKVYISSKPPRI